MEQGLTEGGMLGRMVEDKDIQIRAEIFGFMGDTERSMRGLVEANNYELFDIAWLEGCPLIEAPRRDPAYGPIRDAVAARAGLVRQELGAAP